MMKIETKHAVQSLMLMLVALGINPNGTCMLMYDMAQDEYWYSQSFKDD